MGAFHVFAAICAPLHSLPVCFLREAATNVSAANCAVLRSLPVRFSPLLLLLTPVATPLPMHLPLVATGSQLHHYFASTPIATKPMPLPPVSTLLLSCRKSVSLPVRCRYSRLTLVAVLWPMLLPPVHVAVTFAHASISGRHVEVAPLSRLHLGRHEVASHPSSASIPPNACADARSAPKISLRADRWPDAVRELSVRSGRHGTGPLLAPHDDDDAS